MNKPQYLAELNQLLIFMTSADREQTIARYGALFDKVGPEGAEALVDRVGSPTRVSIRLSRVYEPGRLEDKVLEAEEAAQRRPKAPEKPNAPEKKAPSPAPASAPSYTVPPLVIDDLPDFEPPTLPLGVQPVHPEPAPAPEQSPEEPEDEYDEADEPDEAYPEEDEDEDDRGEPDHLDWLHGDSAAHHRPAPPARQDHAGPEPAPAPAGRPAPIAPIRYVEERPAPETVIERSMPLGAGIPLFILCLIVLAIPLGALCLLVIPICLAPGLALGLCTWLAAVGGLWCVSYIPDAVMLFGLAFVILSAALVVFWFGLQIAVTMVKLYIRGCQAVTHLTLGRKVTLDA